MSFPFSFEIITLKGKHLIWCLNVSHSFSYELEGLTHFFHKNPQLDSVQSQFGVIHNVIILFLLKSAFILFSRAFVSHLLSSLDET